MLSLATLLPPELELYCCATLLPPELVYLCLSIYLPPELKLDFDNT
jgi:hypothetical protein